MICECISVWFKVNSPFFYQLTAKVITTLLSNNFVGGDYAIGMSVSYEQNIQKNLQYKLLIKIYIMKSLVKAKL